MDFHELKLVFLLGEYFTERRGVPHVRSTAVAQHLGIGSDDWLTVDDTRNDREIFRSLFSGANVQKLDALWRDAIRQFKSKTISDCATELEILRFYQGVFNNAWVTYKIELAPRQYDFVRDFDRLDVPSELARFHEWAQTID
jgi:hypothetical protein